MLKKTFVLICFLLVVTALGCSGKKTRDPKKNYLDEVKHVTKKDISYMGLFFTKPVKNFYADKTADPPALFISLENVDIADVKLPKKLKDSAIKSIQVKNVESAGTQYGQVWLQLSQDVDFATRKTEYGLRVDFRPTGKPLETVESQVEVPDATAETDPQDEETLAEDKRIETQDKELEEQAKTEAETQAPDISDEVFSAPEPAVVAAPEPDSTPPSTEPEPETETQIQNILEKISRSEFKKLERITLTGSAALDFQQTIMDRQVVIQLKGSTISSSVFPVEVDEEKSYLSKITTETSNEPYGGAKVIVQFRESIIPKVKTSGNQIFIDFEKPRVATVLNGKKIRLGEFGNYLESPSPLPGRKISLHTDGAKIHDVLRMLSQASSYNIIAGSSVEGKLTLRLKRVPWDQAFIAILQAHQLGYVKQGNILRVSTLHNLQQEKETAHRALKAKEMLSPMHVMFMPLVNRKAAMLTKHIYPMLSEKGSLSIDRPSNTIIIRDTSEVLETLKKFIASLDADLSEEK